MKVMLTVVLDYRDIAHYEFLLSGKTVNKEYYSSIVRRLREAIYLEWPKLRWDNSRYLHDNNAPALTLFFKNIFSKTLFISLDDSRI